MKFLDCVKLELVDQIKLKPCCRFSLLFGFFLFYSKSKEEMIKISFSSLKMGEQFLKLFCKSFEEEEVQEIRRKEGNFSFRIRGSLLNRILPEEEPLLSRIQNTTTCNDCIQHFYGGIFLKIGQLEDPSQGYHLEMVSSDVIKLNCIGDLLAHYSFGFKYRERGTQKVLYCKQKEEIEDFLNFIGAKNSTLAFINYQIEKDFRNRINRITNCETANIGKTIKAAQQQVGEIKYIVESKGWEYIPDELIEIALLRFENPELSLRELGMLMLQPLSKTAVNNRLNRLLRIAEEIRKEDIYEG